MSKTFGERLAENYAATGRLMSAVYKNISDDHWYPIFQAGKLVAKTAYRTWRKVRSPIEDAMGASFFRETLDRKIVLYDPRGEKEDDRFPTWIWCVEALDLRRIDFRSNRKIGRFVFDFSLEGFGKKSVVECDGLAWHWGDQKKRDRDKDEFSLKNNYRMFRFTSKQIMADSRSCAKQVIDYIVGGVS